MNDLVENILNEELKKINPDLKQYMIEYICESYQTMLEMIKKSPSRKETPFLIKMIKKECDNILSLDIDEQKSIIVPDKYYEKLQNYTNKVYILAMRKKEGKEIQKISQDEKEMILKNVDILKSKIQSFNLRNAERLISDFVLELQYITTNTDIESLRMR